MTDYFYLRFLLCPTCKPTFALRSEENLAQSILKSLISPTSMGILMARSEIAGADHPIERILPFPERHPQWH